MFRSIAYFICFYYKLKEARVWDIYKIQNNVNQKVYIGQTVAFYEKRFRQHRNNYTKPYFAQLALYKAFKKYGLHNFSFEVIEQVENSALDEREKYWISYYDSYNNGYNSTLGGKLVELYEWDNELIKKLYSEHKSARAVAKIIGCDHSTIDHLLNVAGIKRFSEREQKGQKVIILKDDKILCECEDSFAAAQWLIEHGYSNSSKVRSVRVEVLRAIRQEKKYLGLSFNNPDSISK